MWRHAFRLPKKEHHQSELQSQATHTSLAAADIDAAGADLNPHSDRDSCTAEDVEGFLCDWANEAFEEGEDYANDFYHYFGNSPWVYAQFRFWCQRVRRLDLEQTPFPVLPLDFSGPPPNYTDIYDGPPSYTHALEQSPAPPPFDRYSRSVIAQFREERAQFPTITVYHNRSPLPEVLDFFSPSIELRSLWATTIPPVPIALTLPATEWDFDESSPISAFWAQLIRAIRTRVPSPSRLVSNRPIATQFHSRPLSEVHDQMIVLLADTAAVNPDFRSLMRTVAHSQATQEQLQAFQGHVDELRYFIETPTPVLSQTSSPTVSASEPATPEADL